jgi:hypothetical protein
MRDLCVDFEAIFRFNIITEYNFCARNEYVRYIYRLACKMGFIRGHCKFNQPVFDSLVRNRKNFNV